MLRSVLEVQPFFLLFLDFLFLPQLFATFRLVTTILPLRMRASIVSHFNNNILNSIIISCRVVICLVFLEKEHFFIILSLVLNRYIW
jgi:hypothetical protein